MNIIAVDDEKGALFVLVDSIKKACPEAELEAFQFPAEALDYSEKNPVDVAFLDVDMPLMSGVELAKKLKKCNPKINIVFSTAYSEYGVQAMQLHASGYLLKPVTVESVKREMENLRFPTENNLGIKAVTFGQFDLFVDGKPVIFLRSKSKEMLAYLIDRNGGGVNKVQLFSALFEDKPYDASGQDYMKKIATGLKDSLKKVDADKILIIRRNYFAVDKSKFACDLYDYYEGKPEGLNAFHGEYMTAYSWGEYTLSALSEGI